MALNPQQRQSQQILGAGIILTGALILAIGLIIGLEFPRYIRDRLHSRACVTSPVSHDYRDWLHNRNRSKYNVLRIWNLTNLKEFLTEGQAPQFSLAGPYVFEETEEKKGVTFNGGHVTYRVGRMQTFSAEKTAKECPDCSLDDTVTILNPAFLQRAGIHREEFNFYRMLVPTVLSDPKLRDELRPHLKPSLTPQRRVKTSPNSVGKQPWDASELDFDEWLQRDRSALYWRIVNRENGSITIPSVYLRVYERLGDSKIYGGEVFLRPSLYNACLRHYSNIANSAITNPPLGAEPTSVGSTFEMPFESVTNASATEPIVRESSTVTPAAPSCGLLFYLYQLNRTSSFADWRKFHATLSSYFCDDASGLGLSAASNTDVTGTCFLRRTGLTNGNAPTGFDKRVEVPIGENATNQTRDYLEAVAGYAVDYLPSVLRNRVPLTSARLWDRVTVREAAMGYYVNPVTLDRFDDVTSGNRERRTKTAVVRVRGFLDHSNHSIGEDAGDHSHLFGDGYHSVTLRTCLYNRSQQNNLNYEVVDGFHTDPDEKNAGHQESLLVHGQQDFKVRSANKLTPCRSPAPTLPYVILYSPETWRPANYVFSGYANYRWVALHDYRLQLDRVDESSQFSTSLATGYPSWVSPLSSLPDTKETRDVTNHESKKSNGRRKWISENNKVLIEPVSGQVWRTETDLSYWVGFWWIPGAKMFDPGGINTSYVGAPFRSHQISSYTEPADQIISLYQHQIYSLMQASCTGIVSLSIVGSIVILIGIGVAFSLIHRPPYRVSPQSEDPPTQALPYDGVNVVLDREMDQPDMMDANIYF